MDETEWKNFWKNLLFRAEKPSIDFLIDFWLEYQKDGFEDALKSKGLEN